MVETPRLLIADDHEDLLKLYQLNLKNEGYIIDVSCTVDDAIDKLRREVYNAVIVDLKMPGGKSSDMGGLDIMKEIIGRNLSTRVIVATAYGTSKLSRDALKEGVYDFIDKPIDFIELKEIVKSAIMESRIKVQRINPFCPTAGVEPKVFGGRFNEMRVFEKKLNECAEDLRTGHLLVLGSWGIGKTMLLREFKMLAQDKGGIAAVVTLDEFDENCTVMDGVERIIESVYREWPYSHSKLESFISSLKGFGIQIAGTGVTYDRETTKSKLQPYTVLYDSLQALWKDIQNNGGKVLVVMLDDAQYLAPISKILTTIKQVLSNEQIIKNTRILFVISCLPEKWHEFVHMEALDPVGRYFLSKINLSPLTNEDMSYTVQKTLAGTGVTFLPEVIDRVCYYTQGNPFKMQVLCRNLYDNQISGKVDLKVWEKGMQNTLSDLGMAIYEFWFSQAGVEGVEILKAIILRGSALSVKEFEDVFEKKGINITFVELEKCLQFLDEKKLICKVEGGGYDVVDKMFSAYIKFVKLKSGTVI